IDVEFKFGRLLDREIGGPGAFSNLCGADSGAAGHASGGLSPGKETPRVPTFPAFSYLLAARLSREICAMWAARCGGCAPAPEKDCARPSLICCLECDFNIRGAFDV